MANKMVSKAIKLISALVEWIDDIYESLLAGGNTKEGVWWITTQVIRTISEEYLAPEHSTASKTSFDRDSQRRSTLILGVIKGHLYAKIFWQNTSRIILLLLWLTPNGL